MTRPVESAGRRRRSWVASVGTDSVADGVWGYLGALPSGCLDFQFALAKSTMAWSTRGSPSNENAWPPDSRMMVGYTPILYSLASSVSYQQRRRKRWRTGRTGFLCAVNSTEFHGGIGDLSDSLLPDRLCTDADMAIWGVTISAPLSSATRTAGTNVA